MTVAVCIEAPTRFARYTVYNGAAIPKGTLCILSAAGVNFAHPSISITTQSTPVAGIAYSEKVAADGSTELGFALDGTWDIVCNGVCTSAGQLVTISGADTFGNGDSVNAALGAKLGYALEPATHGTATRVRVDV